MLKQNQEQKKGNFLVSCSPNKVVKGELFSVVQFRPVVELLLMISQEIRQSVGHIHETEIILTFAILIVEIVEI